MSSVKQESPTPALKPGTGFCDDCRKVHMGGSDVCPRLKTKKDLYTFLDEIGSSIEPRPEIKPAQIQPSASLPDLVQERTEKKITLKHLPCDRFAVAGGFFGGPMITIYMGPEDTKKKYILSKNLLSSVSPFFKTAFEESYKESQEHIWSMDGDKAENLELLIQWLYIDTIVLHQRKSASDSPQDKLLFQQDVISRCLSFLVFCDKLLLPVVCGEAVTQMRITLSENRQALSPVHIRTAIKLPDGHPARQLFADAAVVDYMDAQTREGGKFWLSKEMEEHKVFAADLLSACGALWASCGISKRGNVDWVDPLTKKSCNVDTITSGKIQFGSSLSK